MSEPSEFSDAEAGMKFTGKNVMIYVVKCRRESRQYGYAQVLTEE